MKINKKLLKKITTFNNKIKLISEDRNIDNILKIYSLKSRLSINILKTEVKQILTTKANYKQRSLINIRLIDLKELLIKI